MGHPSSAKAQWRCSEPCDLSEVGGKWMRRAQPGSRTWPPPTAWWKICLKRTYTKEEKRNNGECIKERDKSIQRM